MHDFRQTMIEFAQAGFYVFPKLRRFKKGENVSGMPPGWNHNKESEWASSNNINTVIEWIGLNDIIGYGINRRKDCFIIDIDCGKGKSHAGEALASLATLKSEFKLPKPSITVRTKSGGYHFFFAHPNINVGQVISALPGIDFPIHVVGPEGVGDWVHGTYTVIGGKIDNELQPMSKKVITWLEANFVKKYEDHTRGLVSVDEQEVFDGSIPDVIEDGKRHVTMLRLIASWVRRGYSRKNCVALLQTALTQCEGGDYSDKLDEYVERLDDTLSKPQFNRTVPDPLKFFLENAIYVKQHDGVFEIHSRKMYMKNLTNVYAHLHWYEEPPAGSKTKPKIKYGYQSWLMHSDRRIVDSYGYRPTEELIYIDPTQRCEVVNTYTKPNLPPPINYEAWDKFEYFAQYIGGTKYEKLMDWAAWQVQRPERKLQIAIAMISELQGVGKNLFINVVERCIGVHNCIEFSLSKLLDKHNDYPLKTHLAVINEAYSDLIDRYSHKEKSKVINEVKDLITNKSISVNPKFVQISAATSYVNYAFTSNNLHSIPMEENDRRFEVFLGPTIKLSDEEYGYLWNMTDADIAAIQERLMERKITKITDQYSATEIDADKQAVIDAGRSFVETDLVEAIKNKQSVFKDDILVFELFAWFILNNVSKVSQGYCRDLFRKFCKPVYRKTGTQVRNTRLNVPALEFKGGDYLPEALKHRSLYCCRDWNKYNGQHCRDTMKTSELKFMYTENFNTTKVGYKDIPEHLKVIEG